MVLKWKPECINKEVYFKEIKNRINIIIKPFALQDGGLQVFSRIFEL